MSTNRIPVAGVAVKSGVSRNGIMYTKDELRKFANTMNGISIIKDHAALVDNAVGVVESASFNETNESVEYIGWIKDDRLSEQVKDGRVKHVSIGAMVGKLVKESEDSEYLIAKDMTCCELSTVVVPGVPGATIAQALSESRPIKEKVSEISPIPVQTKSIIKSDAEQFENIKEVKSKMEEKIEPAVPIEEKKVENNLDSEIKKLQELKSELLEIKNTLSEMNKPKVEEVKEEIKAPVVEDKTIGEVKETSAEPAKDASLIITREDGGFAIFRTDYNDNKFVNLRR